MIATNYKSIGRRVRPSGAMRAKTVRRAIGVALLAGGAYAVWRVVVANQSGGVGGDPQPFPFPPQSRTVDAEPDTSPAWREPVDGVCPASHPVKAKLRSGIYHRPGGQSYERTRPDRCYRDDAAAEADGLRAAKR
ncbi:MAG TPA: hypothetical protein VLV81_01595 [Acidimicrobiia bacterium]|nr:hypothetical protein [Acidimicrobiia bacterium]